MNEPLSVPRPLPELPPEPVPEASPRIRPDALQAAAANIEPTEVSAKESQPEPGPALRAAVGRVARAMVVRESQDRPPSPSPIADALRPYVDEQKLADNVNNYPELTARLKPEKAAAVERMKAHLLRVPLVHSVRSVKMCQAIQHDGLRPLADLPPRKGNTYRLDQSLGLDRYGFMQWGELSDPDTYGGRHVLLRSEVLLRPQTIVTPEDIAVSSVDQEEPYQNQPAEYQEQIQTEYFDRMLRGRDWLELIGRRMLAHAQTFPDEPYGLLRGDFGEIKHLGPIEPTMVEAILDGPNARAARMQAAHFYSRMRSLGFDCWGDTGEAADNESEDFGQYDTIWTRLLKG